jgi:hypothetical protein
MQHNSKKRLFNQRLMPTKICKILMLFGAIVTTQVAAEEESLHLSVKLYNHQTSNTKAIAASPLVSHVTRQAVSKGKVPTNAQIKLPEKQLLVIAEDSKGNEVSRAVVYNPLVFHSEIFDQYTGEVLESKIIEKSTGNFDVTLKNSDNINTLKIYKTVKNGKLVLIEQVAVIKEKSRAAKSSASKESPTHMQAPTSEVKAVFNTGDSANRHDLIFLAEGYTSSEMGKFQRDVDEIVAGYFGYTPYLEYKNLFNVWRIEAPSSVSGVGGRFGSHFNCNGIDRLLCADTTTAKNYVWNNTGMDANQIDQIVVLVNTTQYGGAGGEVAVMSLGSSAVGLALHEIGHSFGQLADEYVTNPELCGTMGGPTEANVTGTFGDKWAHWQGVDGVNWFLGSKYCPAEGSTVRYRPTDNSMMKTLGTPFYAVNSEALVLRAYDFANVIDSTSPSQSSVNATSGSQTLSVQTVQPVPNQIEANWYVNNNWVASGTSLTITSSVYGVGTHTVRVDVKDNTTLVRKDSFNNTTDSNTWNVTLGECSSDCGGCTTDCGELGIVSPVDGSTLTSSSETFTWNESSAEGYWLYAGSTVGANDYFSSSSQVNGTSEVVTGLPEDGSTVYITFLYYVDGQWENIAYTYTANEANGTHSCSAQPFTTTLSKPINTVESATSFTATWNTINEATSYTVDLWVNGVWQVFDSTSQNEYTFNDLAANSTQYVRVAATNCSGEQSGYSAWTEITLIGEIECTEAPAIPTGISGSSQTISWSAVPGATGYDIQYWTGAWTNHGSSATTSYNLGLSGTQYVRVSATNSCGTSTYSEFSTVN